MAPKTKVLVANGVNVVGFPTVHTLAQKKELVEIITHVHDDKSHPHTMERLEQLGAKVVLIEGNKSENYENLFKDIDRAFVIPNYTQGRMKSFNEERQMIDAARKIGIKFMLLLGSVVNADEIERRKMKKLEYFKDYFDLENYLRRPDFLPEPKDHLKGFIPEFKELKYAVLRANVFQEDLLLFAEDVKKKDLLHLPIGNQSAFAPISVKDIAEVATDILTGSDNDLMKVHNGKIYELTGPESLKGKDVANTASKVLGRTIHFDGSIPDDGGKAYMESLTVPPDREHPYPHHVPVSEAHQLFELWKFVHDGYLKDTKQDLKKLIGRDGQTMHEFFERRRKYFTAEEE